MKSSSLVSKALQEFEDNVQNMEQKMKNEFQQNQNLNQNNNSSSRRNSSQTSSMTTKTQSRTEGMLPSSTPNMEIVPSGGNNGLMSPAWSMGTDAQGEVPLTYEIVTRADGKKEFQVVESKLRIMKNQLQ